MRLAAVVQLLKGIHHDEDVNICILRDDTFA